MKENCRATLRKRNSAIRYGDYPSHANAVYSNDLRTINPDSVTLTNSEIILTFYPVIIGLRTEDIQYIELVVLPIVNGIIAYIGKLIQIKKIIRLTVPPLVTHMVRPQVIA